MREKKEGMALEGACAWRETEGVKWAVAVCAHARTCMRRKRSRVTMGEGNTSSTRPMASATAAQQRSRTM